MFEAVELGRRLTRDEYSARVPELRTELLRVQKQLSTADFPVIILVNGADGAGKGETVNLLHEWMDARYIVTQAFGKASDEERERPEYWRYWMTLPPKGRIGIFFGSWYTTPILERVYGEISDQELEHQLTRVRAFEKTLVDDGALIVKLWFHIGKRDQRRRLKELESSKETRWRVSKRDWKHHALYDEFIRVTSRTLRETSTGEAPWTLIEGAEARFRSVSVAEHVVGAIDKRLTHPPRLESSPPPDPNIADPVTILDSLDLSLTLAKKDYEQQLGNLQGRLNRLSRKLAKKRLGVSLVFEGWDAAGKGGVIRRITHALDARQYRVIPIAAPSEEERAQHYLWRFWRQIPRKGRVTIYDRSWYGRVLVERCEGFARESEWLRAYKEINDFEEQLCENGTLVCKFWLHISDDEQLRRFKERETHPWKQYKITPEDYRNRGKWSLYESATSDMVARTSTEYAPWTLVEANDKRYARVMVLRTLCAAIERALKGKASNSD